MHAIQNSSDRKCEAKSVGKAVRDLNNTRQTDRDGGVWKEKRNVRKRREMGLADIISFHRQMKESKSPAEGASDDITTRRIRPASAQPGRTLRRLGPP